jgi:hypothetical protein
VINTEDQEALFQLIATYLSRDISCVAIGGTAMMFAQYKTTTKDIDLVFQTTEDRDEFISVIKQLGYQEQSLQGVYDTVHQANTGKPVMFTRGDERFDLFVQTVFGYKISFSQEIITQRNDFLADNKLSIDILSAEELVLLKAITGRNRDYEDIETILKVKKNLDWKTNIQAAIAQKENNEWILIDLEETLQKLKGKYQIKQEFFDMIYQEQK